MFTKWFRRLYKLGFHFNSGHHFKRSKFAECWPILTNLILIHLKWTFVCERYWLRSVTLSAYVVGQSIAGFFVGWISDRLGRKFAIKYCIILELICECYLIVINNEFLFMAGRVLHGMAGFGRSLCSIILRKLESLNVSLSNQLSIWLLFNSNGKCWSTISW